MSSAVTDSLVPTANRQLPTADVQNASYHICDICRYRCHTEYLSLSEGDTGPSSLTYSRS
jgi:hypothetical protein